jgi:septal ring-binding cell division protein DamX
MAGGNGKRGGDRVLESRHLVGLFLGVVLLCGVFYTLGYVMGRTQDSGSVHAAVSAEKSAPVKPAPAKTKDTVPVAAPAPSEWDFYSKKNDNRAQPAAKAPALVPAPLPAVSTKTAGGPAPVAAKPEPTPAAPSARFPPPRMLTGAIVVQVAALTRESDALAMADAVQQKGFPSFVVTPTADRFFRVQVGPYSDQQAAESAKRALEQLGFKPIVKR